MAELFNASHKYRCVFIHVPKAAGTSIKTVLNMPGSGHLTWFYYAFYFPQIWRQYTSFAVVRNPWDRIVSTYHFLRMKVSYLHPPEVGPHADYEVLRDRSFEECLTILLRERERLTSEAWYEQTHLVALPVSLGARVMVDRVLRFETLDAEFPRLCAELGVDGRNMPQLNSTKRGRDYREYYNGHTRRLVARLYASDIETFGYSF